MTCDYPEVRVNDEAAKADVESGIYTRHYQIRPSDTVLDIGAHVGYFSMWVSPLCKKVIAFEPEHYNFKRLMENTKRFLNVRCVNAAATHQIGTWNTAYLNINTGNSGGHALARNQNEPLVKVDCVDIGSYLRNWGLEPDFAKIDAEGSELNILISLKNAELRFPMAIEIHSHELFCSCSALLEHQGYKLIPKESHVGVCYAMP